MTSYSPCGGCARKDGCAVLASVRASVSGNGRAISSIRVNCGKVYQTDFPAGTRVYVSGTSYKAKHLLNGEPGTVLGWRQSNGKALVYFDSDEIYRDETDDVGLCRLQSISHREIHRIDEVPRDLCSTCGMLLGSDGEPVRWYNSDGSKHGGCGLWGPDERCKDGERL